MMVEDREGMVTYPQEAPASSGATSTVSSPSSLSIIPAVPALHVDQTSELDEAASKIHHLHVTSNEDDVNRSLRFMHGGASVEGMQASVNLAGSTKRVALGDGDQRMYRHRASVSGSRQSAEGGQRRRIKTSSPETRRGRDVSTKGSKRRPGGDDSRRRSGSASRRQMGLPYPSGGHSIRGGGTTILVPLTLEVMEGVDSPVPSPISHFGSRSCASSVASPPARSRVTTAAPQKPHGQRLRNSTSVDSRDAEEEEATSPLCGAERGATRKESATSDDVSSPVWHLSPRADASLSPPHKDPLIHRSPMEASPGTAPSAHTHRTYPSEEARPSAGGDRPRADAYPSERGNRRESHLSESGAGSPIWHTSPRLESLETSHASGQLHQRLPETERNKAPVLHYSPRESVLGAGHSRAVEVEAAARRDDSSAVHEDGLEAGLSVWSRPPPGRTGRSPATDSLDISRQSVSKAPIMHRSPASSGLGSPSPVPYAASRSGADHAPPHRLGPIPQLPPRTTTEGLAQRKLSRKSSRTTPHVREGAVREPAPPARKPAVPRFPHRQASRDLTNSGESGREDAPHQKNSSPSPARRRSSNAAKLSQYVSQYEANAAGGSATRLPTVLPSGAAYPTEKAAASPPPPLTSVNTSDEHTTGSGNTSDGAHGGGAVGESLLDQILRRNAAATGTQAATSATTSNTALRNTWDHARGVGHVNNASFLTSDYQRPYELTAADSVHRNSASRRSSGVPRASATLASLNGTAFRRGAGHPSAVAVQREKMDALLPVKGGLGGGSIFRATSKWTSSRRPSSMQNHEGQKWGSSAEPVSARTAAPLPSLTVSATRAAGEEPTSAGFTHRDDKTDKKTETRSGESAPAARTTDTTTRLPLLAARWQHKSIKHSLPAAAKRQPFYADGATNHPTGTLGVVTVRYANSPYLQSAVAAQKTARTAVEAAALRRTRRKKTKKNKQKRAPKVSARSKGRKRMNYADILKADDRYAHVLTHHGFWGELAF